MNWRDQVLSSDANDDFPLADGNMLYKQISVMASDTIAELKNKIMGEMNIPVNDQQLYHHTNYDIPLGNGQTLGEAGITSDMMVTCGRNVD